MMNPVATEQHPMVIRSPKKTLQARKWQIGAQAPLEPNRTRVEYIQDDKIMLGGVYLGLVGTNPFKKPVSAIKPGVWFVRQQGHFIIAQQGASSQLHD